MKNLLLIIHLCLVPMTTFGITLEERLENPDLEQRAKTLFKLLRCAVCTSESINDSKAPLAQDLRMLVRKRLNKGDSNEEILHFIHQRYGNSVLMKPPLNLHTYFLWFAPLILTIIGLGIVIAMVNKYHRKK